MSRQAQALIDLSAMHHNIKRVAEIAKNQKILAMVKANAYGHGTLRLAHSIKDQIDGFGVASLEEALELRQDHINKPIIIMSRFWNREHLAYCSSHNLGVVVHQTYQVEIIEKNPQTKPFPVWLKLETGMHRLGLDSDEFQDAWQRLQKIAWVQKPLIIMTHLACADNLSDSLTTKQIRRFHQLTQEFPGPKSIANSAAILSRSESLADWVRPGIMLYGSSPFADKTAQECGLLPVMTLSAPLIAIKKIKKGDSVGYGATWTCPQDMLMGVIAIGYGDGYPRHACSGTPVLLNGKICPLIGRVSMDMINIDLSELAQAKIGDEAILWGQGLAAEKIAQCSQTITYELFCKVNSRVKFIVHE
jgi:alanine racemase